MTDDLDALLAQADQAIEREPQPTDGPDYHADHQAWQERQIRYWRETANAAGRVILNARPDPRLREQAALSYEALDVIRLFVDWFDDEDCRFDERGICQSHTLDADCPVPRARAVLAAARTPPGTDPVTNGDSTAEAAAYECGPGRPCPDRAHDHWPGQDP